MVDRPDDWNSKNLSARMRARGVAGSVEMPQLPLPAKLPASGGCYLCPVDYCSWSLDVPQPITDVRMTDTGFKATMQGVDPASLERVLAEHFEFHTPVDFLRTIQRLRNDLARAQATAETGT